MQETTATEYLSQDLRCNDAETSQALTYLSHRDQRRGAADRCHYAPHETGEQDRFWPISVAG